MFVRGVGADVVLSKQPKAPMQSLLDAVIEFEDGFTLERSQPVQPDVREALFATPKR